MRIPAQTVHILTSMPGQSVKRVDGGQLGGKKVIPNCVEFRLTYLVTAGPVFFSVCHARIPAATAVNTALADNLATALNPFFTSSLLATFVPTTVRIGLNDVRDLRAPDLPLIPTTVSLPAGTSASPALPPEVSLVATLRTANAGRQNRGRVYVAGLAQNASVSAGVATDPARLAVQAYITGLRTACTSAGLTLAIGQVHRQEYTGITGTLHPDRPANVVDVTAVVCRDVRFDSQRRRAQV